MAKNDQFTLNRRDFLRIAGLGAGATAVATVTKSAAAATPTAFAAGKFLESRRSSQTAIMVKTVDEPTVK